MLGCLIEGFEKNFKGVKINTDNIEFKEQDKSKITEYVNSLNEDVGLKLFEIEDNKVLFDPKLLKDVQDTIDANDKQQLLDIEFTDSDSLFATRFLKTYADNSSSVAEQITLNVWNTRLDYFISHVKRNADRYRKRGDIKKAIETEAYIEDLKKLKANQVSDLIVSFSMEMSKLNMLVSKVGVSHNILEDSALIDRLNALEMMLFVKDIVNDTKYYDVSENDLPDNPTLHQYALIHDTIQEAIGKTAMERFRKEFYKIQENFNRAKFNYIKKIVYEDPVIQYNVDNNIWTEEDVNKIIKMIDNGEIEVSYRQYMTLGIASGGSILGQLLNSFRAKQFTAERGVIAEKLDNLLNSWNAIKNKTYNGRRIAAYLYYYKDKGKYKSGRLASIFSKDYYSAIMNLNKLREAVYENPSKENFKSLYNLEKRNFDRIDFRKIRAVRDRFPAYAKYFNFSEEEMQKYEDSIKKLYGEEIFNEYVKQAIAKIEDFTVYSRIALENFGDTGDNKNPFIFLEEYHDRNTFPDYVDDEYTILLPTNTNLLNGKLLKVLNSDKNVAKFYMTAYNLLTNYINPTFLSEGHNIHLLTLPTDINVSINEAVKQNGLYGGVTTTIKDLAGRFLSMFALDTSVKKGFNTAGIYEADSKSKEIKKLFTALGTGELFDTDYEAKKYLDDNLFILIQKGAFAAADVRVRRSLVSALEIFKDVAKNTKNLRAKLENYEEQNVKGNLLNSLRKGGTENKFKLSARLFGKARNRLEKEFLKSIKKLQDTFRDKSKDASFNSLLDEDTRIILNGRTGIIKRINIKTGKILGEVTDDEMKKEFKALYKAAKEMTGKDISFASLLLGIMKIVNYKFLTVNILGGLKNSFYGTVQSRSVAASGRLGFGEKEFDNSVKFLQGYNIFRYLGRLVQNTEKAKKFKTFSLLINSMDMIQNRADELADAARFSERDLTSLSGKAKDLALDPHINNPELHNQGNVILSIAQTIKVKRREEYGGGYGYLFDGKDFIWEPGTLKLKDEYRTPENIDMWEKFRQSKTGKQDFVAFYIKATAAVDKTQGNYRNFDRVPMQDSLTGKSIMFYRRYFMENFDAEYGSDRVDIRFGKFDMKGRKLALFEHAPILSMYILTPTFGKMLSDISKVSLYSAVAGPPIGIGVGIVKFLTNHLPKAFFAYKAAMNSEWELSHKELKLAYSFFLETVKRALSTPVEILSAQHFSLFKKSIQKSVAKDIEELKITEDERKLLSEASQNLAMRMVSYINLTIAALALKALYMTLNDVDCVKLGLKEKDCEAKKKANIKSIDQYVNNLLNLRNALQDDFAKYDNAINAFNDLTNNASIIYIVKNISKSIKEMSEAATAAMQGKWNDAESSIGDAIKDNPFVPIPNTFFKAKEKGIVGHIFKADHVYGNRLTPIDKAFIYDRYKPKETLYNSAVRKWRVYQKERLKEYFEPELKKKYISKGYFDEEIDAAIKQDIQSFIKSYYYKERNEKYKDVYERISKDKLIKVIEQYGGGKEKFIENYFKKKELDRIKLKDIKNESRRKEMSRKKKRLKQYFDKIKEELNK